MLRHPVISLGQEKEQKESRGGLGLDMERAYGTCQVQQIATPQIPFALRVNRIEQGNKH